MNLRGVGRPGWGQEPPFLGEPSGKKCFPALGEAGLGSGSYCPLPGGAGGRQLQDGG